MGGAWWQRKKTHHRAPKTGGGHDGSGTLQRENQNRVIPEAFLPEACPSGEDQRALRKSVSPEVMGQMTTPMRPGRRPQDPGCSRRWNRRNRTVPDVQRDCSCHRHGR